MLSLSKGADYTGSRLIVKVSYFANNWKPSAADIKFMAYCWEMILSERLQIQVFSKLLIVLLPCS